MVTRQDKFSVILNIIETEQLQIENWVETKRNSIYTAFRDRTKLQKNEICLVSKFSVRQTVRLVANAVHTADTDKTRQDKTVLFCPCQRCELGIAIHTVQRSFWRLTLSPPIALRLYTLSYWSNPPILIFDIRALWRSGLSARAPECQKLKWWVRPVWR